MRPGIYIIFSLFICSCTSTHKYYEANPSGFPIFGKRERILLYYKDEPLPERDYIETASFNFQLKGEVPSEECLRILKHKASLAKVDAVINIHEHVDSYYGMTGADLVLTILDAFCEDCEDVVYESEILTTRISGTGIKYVENILACDNLIKTTDLYLTYDDVQKEDIKIACIYKDIAGGIDSIDYQNEMYSYLLNSFLLPFSDYKLFEEMDGWTYSLDSHGRLKNRTKDTKDVFTFRYDQKGKISSVRYRNDALGKYAKINLKFDKKNRVVFKEIRRSGLGVVKLENKYRHGRLVYQDIKYENNTEYLNFYTLNDFYRTDEIESTLFKLLKKYQSEQKTTKDTIDISNKTQRTY